MFYSEISVLQNFDENEKQREVRSTMIQEQSRFHVQCIFTEQHINLPKTKKKKKKKKNIINFKIKRYFAWKCLWKYLLQGTKLEQV